MKLRCIHSLSFPTLFLFAAAALAQEAAPPIAYAVSTVKPGVPGSGYSSYMFEPYGFYSSNMPLRNVIRITYGLQDDQMENVPDWVKTTYYDITAKVDDEDRAALAKLSTEQRTEMVKPLLAERFKLKAHFETRDLPVYALVIAKGGAKVADAATDKTVSRYGQGIHMSHGALAGFHTDMDNLAQVLSRSAKRTVVDKTGLTGSYNFVLNWTEDDTPADPASSAPSLFTAIQEQLGLKLETAKVPMPVLVIDHIEPPTPD